MCIVELWNWEVMPKEHDPHKEQSDSFSEMTNEMFSDVHSGTVEEGKDQIRQFWEEQRGAIGYYLSTLEEEERNTVIASAENHTVQKVVFDYRYSKYSLYALTAGIVFEYDLKTGVVKDWFSSELTDDTDHLNRTIDCVKRWPEVDLLSYADHINKMKQHIEFCCHIIQQHSVWTAQSTLHWTELIVVACAKGKAATQKQTTTAENLWTLGEPWNIWFMASVAISVTLTGWMYRD